MHGRKFNRRKFLKYRAILANLYLQRDEEEQTSVEQDASKEDPQELMGTESHGSQNAQHEEGTGLVFNQDQVDALRDKVNKKIQEHKESSIERSRNLHAGQRSPEEENPKEHDGQKYPGPDRQTIEEQLKEQVEDSPLQAEQGQASSGENIIDSTLEKLESEDKKKESEDEKPEDDHADIKKKLAEQLKYFQIDLDDMEDEESDSEPPENQVIDAEETETKADDVDEQADIEDLSDVEEQLNSLEKAAGDIKKEELVQEEQEPDTQERQESKPDSEVHPDIVSEFQKKMENSIKLENSILRKIRNEEKNLKDMRENFEGLVKKISQINSKESYERKKMNELNKKIMQLSSDKNIEKQELSDVSHRLDELFQKEQENEKIEKDIYDKFGNSQKEMENMELELQYLQELQEKLSKDPDYSEEKLNDLKGRIVDSQKKLSKLKN